MIEEPLPAADAMVVAVKEKDAAAAASRYRGLGELQAGGSSLMTFRLRAPARDPREAWRKVLEENPDAEWVAPLFRDASGNELLPTGAIVVRFRRKLSDRALEAFAAQQGVVLTRRNEFVPEQASFRPHRPREAYLPDLIASITRHADVAAAWPSTSGRYRKL